MHDMNIVIFHSLGLHDELILVVVLIDATSINYLTRPGAGRDWFLNRTQLIVKDIPIPLTHVSTLTSLLVSKGPSNTCLIQPHGATYMISHVYVRVLTRT
jgi:hypothetical protein